MILTSKPLQGIVKIISSDDFEFKTITGNVKIDNFDEFEFQTITGNCENC